MDRRQGGADDWECWNNEDGFNNQDQWNNQEGFNNRDRRNNLDGFNNQDRRNNLDGFNNRDRRNNQDGFNNQDRRNNQDGFNNRDRRNNQDGFNNRDRRNNQDGFNNRDRRNNQDGFNNRDRRNNQDGFNNRDRRNNQEGFNNRDRRNNQDGFNNWDRRNNQDGFNNRDRRNNQDGFNYRDYNNGQGNKGCDYKREYNNQNQATNSNWDHEQRKCLEKNWECTVCQFSNYPTRTTCYKCKNCKEFRPSTSTDNKAQEWKPIDWDAFHNRSERIEKERWAVQPPIEKNLYIEDPEIANMSYAEVQRFREKNFKMTAHFDEGGSDKIIPNPVVTFKQAFGPYPKMLAEIERQGFTDPTPIQSQSWPVLLQGYDMIGIAQTGTGKTLAFLLPALLHIVAQPTPRMDRVGPTCLVVAPTRELAQQIEKEVSKYQYENINCVCVYGQGDKLQQIRKINAKAEIVVATPGRLNEFAEKGIIDLSGVSYLVLDEADRMLDMGFEPQIRKIVLDIQPDRQTVLTSATWPEGVRDLASKLLRTPIRVVVGSLDLQAVHTVTQSVIMCSENDKRDKLVEFINGLSKKDKAIVFVGRKTMVDYLTVEMMEEGLYVQSMHGDRDQHDREQALNDLKTGKIRVLIATDVAARGIDITDVTRSTLNYTV
ncbi:probable ATP-dependent RNA helicase DDX43 isoform X2 [Homarus americanus]|uniref:probable ATP-dependent RNA helicase DDX43 isoform X2 n=1 Tax=Homarus americanus TaxID=6706 RepID=UPI001C491736|nr:probable ATP-dependent RNA helicase DDX43 isoform X2 [Homarus americanus]